MKARTAFWLGLAALVALAAMPSKAQDAPPPAAATPPPISAQDLTFARFIATIRAHLLTGDELAGQGNWELARRHYSFPTEEIYGIIRDEVRTYRTPPFDGVLKALVRAATAKNAKQFPKARQKVEDAVAAADTALKAHQPDWPRFTIAVAMEVLKAAPDEYDDAVAKGRVVHPIGYQTARGFILQADRMVESVAAELPPGDAAALADIRAGLTELKQAFVPLNAPKQPVIDSAAVAAIVAKIGQAVGKIA